MDKNKMKKLAESLADSNHVILGLCGAILLGLQCVAPMDKEKSDAMFFTALVLLGYSTLVGSISLKHKINSKKEAKADNEFTKQKQFINQNIMNQKNRIK